jgi:hypothetical protein
LSALSPYSLYFSNATPKSISTSAADRYAESTVSTEEVGHDRVKPVGDDGEDSESSSRGSEVRSTAATFQPEIAPGANLALFTFLRKWVWSAGVTQRGSHSCGGVGSIVLIVSPCCKDSLNIAGLTILAVGLAAPHVIEGFICWTLRVAACFRATTLPQPPFLSIK